MNSVKYRMRVVRGAFLNPNTLDDLGAKSIEKFENDNWLGLDEIVVTLDQIKELQKAMVKHYDDTSVPWYMDGESIDDKDEIVVAFGADDGEGGRIFEFRRDDKEIIQKVVQYGISKGIPAEQMDFMNVKF